MNGSGSPSRRHQSSIARATQTPNSGPTSGLVTKSPLARPAPWPVAKNPVDESYSAASTNVLNGIGPARWIRSARPGVFNR
jgi:hypothetical protein